MPISGSTVKSDQRRTAVIDAAVRRFAAKGYYGTTTAEVAADAGISQPYIYRLFPNKQALFVAVVKYASDRLIGAQVTFIDGLDEAERQDASLILTAIRQGYKELMVHDRELLMFQMQANCAADDPDVAGALRDCFAAQVNFLKENTGASDEQVRGLLGAELLANVVYALGLDHVLEPWARVLSGGHPRPGAVSVGQR